MAEEKFVADYSDPHRCICVRSHMPPYEDGRLPQCNSYVTDSSHNGLCEGCWHTHGEAMAARAAKAGV